MSGDSPVTGDAMQSSGPIPVDRPPLLKDVFVSYASQDAAVANSVVQALEGQGIRCWIAPRDVTPGEFYAGVIVHAIDAAKATVLILSQNATASPHVVREVERAASKRHPVIALRIDQEPLPADLEYFLNTSQWLDASEGEPGRVFPKLVEAVRKVLAGAIVGHASPLPPRELMSAPKRPSLNRSVAVAVGLVVVALLSFAISRSWISSRVAEEKPVAMVAPIPVVPAIPERSVAVLQFVDMSEKKDQEYFSDGLSEELIDMLTKVPDLHVPARTSSFYFKGKQATVADIAQALHVAYVLEGSVRKSRNTLRVTAQLIRADSGYHLWSETYDRQLDEIFKVQDDIANAVVHALKASLVEGLPPQATTAQNNDAYSLFLQARAMRHGGRTKTQAETIVKYFRRAIQLDPGYAPAWAELSRALVYQFNNGYVATGSVDTEARDAADRALTLNTKLGTAHLAKGIVYSYVDWDWPNAEREYRRALDLEPRNADCFDFLSDIALAFGRVDEAQRLLQQAIELDPLDERFYYWLGQLAYFRGNFAEATTEFQKSSDVNPQAPGISAALGVVLLAKGDLQSALEMMQHDSDEESRQWGLALAYHALRRDSDADSMLANLERLHADDSALSIAEVHSYRGETEAAFTWLERAFRQRDTSLYLIKIDPWFRALVPDPRYKALLRKMNLPG
jgi:adenylate cyclase